MSELQYTEHEKRCAQIVDQLTAIIMGDTGYVGPEKFKALTLRLAELLPESDAMERSRMPQCVYVVTSDFYWGRGTDLEGAIASCYKSGARGSQDAVIYLYTGPQEELQKITVDGGAAIHYPQTVTSNRVGKVKLPMKQKGAK